MRLFMEERVAFFAVTSFIVTGSLIASIRHNPSLMGGKVVPPVARGHMRAEARRERLGFFPQHPGAVAGEGSAFSPRDPARDTLRSWPRESSETDSSPACEGFASTIINEERLKKGRMAPHPLTRIPVNTAGVTELCRIPGVNHSMAKAIVCIRKKTPFTGPEELMNVPGIGEKKCETIAGYVTFVHGKRTGAPAGKRE